MHTLNATQLRLISFRAAIVGLKESNSLTMRSHGESSIKVHQIGILDGFDSPHDRGTVMRGARTLA